MESSEQTSFTSSHRPLHQQDQQEGQLSRDQFPVTMSRRHRRRPNGIEATRRHQHRVDPFTYMSIKWLQHFYETMVGYIITIKAFRILHQLGTMLSMHLYHNGKSIISRNQIE